MLQHLPAIYSLHNHYQFDKYIPLSIQGLKSRIIFINLALNSTVGEKHHFWTALPIPQQKKSARKDQRFLENTVSHFLVSHPPPGFLTERLNIPLCLNYKKKKLTI